MGRGAGQCSRQAVRRSLLTRAAQGFTKALPWAGRLLGRRRASSSHDRNEEERAMTKLMLAVLSAAVLGAGGIAAAVGLGDFEPAPVVSLPAASTTTTTGTTGTTITDDGAEDISGPCDEAEHRNDPRCAGTAATATTGTTTTGDGAGDISGPCDEAE